MRDRRASTPLPSSLTGKPYSAVSEQLRDMITVLDKIFHEKVMSRQQQEGKGNGVYDNSGHRFRCVETGEPFTTGIGYAPQKRAPYEVDPLLSLLRNLLVDPCLIAPSKHRSSRDYPRKQIGVLPAGSPESRIERYFIC